MKVLFYILIALVLAALGVAATYMTSGWIGYKVTLWGSAVFVFLGIIIGIRHSALEAIVGTGMYTGAGYMILKTIPELFPIYTGVFVGMSLFSLVMGIGAGLEEAPQRETQQREVGWEAYREHLATLPVATPTANIRECLGAFQTHLNRVWSQLPPDLFEPHDESYELIHTWLQRQFERFVEKPLGCPIARPYGEYEMGYEDYLPEQETPKPEDPKYQPMDIWVNGKYEFDCLVSVRDGRPYMEPPFDYVRVYQYVGPDVPKNERYIAFDQASFELRPASWISNP
jgi:hypothetical protein